MSGAKVALAHNYPRVHGNDALWISEDGIEVQLFNFRMSLDELRDLKNETLESRQVGGLLSAHAFENCEAFDLAHHFPRVFRLEWHDPKRHVLQNLYEHAAQPEHHHRAELRVLAHADYDLCAGGRHFLNSDAVNSGVRLGGLYRRHN